MVEGSATISTYDVFVRRYTASASVRGIASMIEGADQQNLMTLWIFFYEPEAYASVSLGSLDPQAKVLTVNLPLSDFGDTYHVLQTEKPVWIWYLYDEQDFTILVFQIGTKYNEPVGEGFTDLTALTS